MADKPSYEDLEQKVMELQKEAVKRKLAEEALRDSEKRFREIIEDVSNIAVQAYDEKRRVTFWNQASEKLYGYSNNEALGKKLEPTKSFNTTKDEANTNTAIIITVRVCVNE